MPEAVPFKKYIFVYETINLINGKKYIGVHKTDNLDDGYIGNGIISQQKADSRVKRPNPTPFHKAVAKYKYSNFKLTILRFFSTYKDALIYESELVDLALVKSKEYYNVCLGGGGSPTTGIGHTKETIEKLCKYRQSIGLNKGSSNIKAKLNEESVDGIRRLFTDREGNIQRLSVLYNVSASTIRDILFNRTWKTDDTELLSKIEDSRKYYSSLPKEKKPYVRPADKKVRTRDDLRAYSRQWAKNNKDRINGYKANRKAKAKAANDTITVN